MNPMRRLSLVFPILLLLASSPSQGGGQAVEIISGMGTQLGSETQVPVEMPGGQSADGNTIKVWYKVQGNYVDIGEKLRQGINGLRAFNLMKGTIAPIDPTKDPAGAQIPRENAPAPERQKAPDEKTAPLLR